MSNEISLSSKGLHTAGYKNIKNILDFLKSNNEIFTSEIVGELDKISESISLILSNSKDVKTPNFGKINIKLKDSHLKTEITCDFISEIEKILKEKLASFKQEDIDKLDTEIQEYKDILEGTSIKEKTQNVELINEKRELESQRRKISQLQEQIINIELVRKTYLEELEKSKNKENGNIPKQEVVITAPNLEEAKLVEVVEEIPREAIINTEEVPVIVEDKINVIKIEEDKESIEVYKTFYSKDIESIKEFYKTCKENIKATYFIEFINKFFSNKGNVYPKLQIIDFLIAENLDRNYIQKELFIGLASQVNIEKEEEYRYFEKVSKLVFPKRKVIEEDVPVNEVQKEENKTIKTKKKKIKEPEVNNLFNDYHIVFIYLQKLLDNGSYYDFIKFITNGKNNETLIDNNNFRKDVYDLLVKNQIKVKSLYDLALKISDPWRSNQVLGIIRKICSITGDFSFIIKDFWKLHISRQLIIISRLLKSDFYLEYKDILIHFYSELIKLNSNDKIKKLIIRYEEKGIIKNRTKVIIKEEKLENKTGLGGKEKIYEIIETNEEIRDENREKTEELINAKKNGKFRYKEAEMKLILEFVNAEELKEFYLHDRKNFGTGNKHYNYYLYYCEAFERLESDLDPIFWKTAIDNLGDHVDRVYGASGDFNPELREIANRLREEIRLREENKLADDIEKTITIVDDLNSGNDIIKQVSSAVVYILPKASPTKQVDTIRDELDKLQQTDTRKTPFFDGKRQEKGIVVGGKDKIHLEYKINLANYLLNFPRDRLFSQNLENYIKQNEDEDIFIYELIEILSKYDIDIIRDFIKELYKLNLEDEFYTTLYTNIVNNSAFENEIINLIEGFKKNEDENDLEESIEEDYYFEDLNDYRGKNICDEYDFEDFGDVEELDDIYDEDDFDEEELEEEVFPWSIEEVTDENRDGNFEANRDGKPKLRDLLEDLQNNDPQTIDLLHKISKEVNERELLLEEKYFNRGLDRQFNNILEEKNIEKLYAFVVLYKSENVLMTRKINELLLFGLTEEERKSNSKIIKKILIILNK